MTGRQQVVTTLGVALAVVALILGVIALVSRTNVARYSACASLPNASQRALCINPPGPSLKAQDESSAINACYQDAVGDQDLGLCIAAVRRAYGPNGGG